MTARPTLERVACDADLPADGEPPFLGAKRRQLPAGVEDCIGVPTGIPRVPEERPAVEEPVEGRDDPDGPALRLLECL